MGKAPLAAMVALFLVALCFAGNETGKVSVRDVFTSFSDGEAAVHARFFDENGLQIKEDSRFSAWTWVCAGIGCSAHGNMSFDEKSGFHVADMNNLTGPPPRWMHQLFSPASIWFTDGNASLGNVSYVITEPWLVGRRHIEVGDLWTDGNYIYAKLYYYEQGLRFPLPQSNRKEARIALGVGFPGGAEGVGKLVDMEYDNSSGTFRYSLAEYYDDYTLERPVEGNISITVMATSFGYNSPLTTGSAGRKDSLQIPKAAVIKIYKGWNMVSPVGDNFSLEYAIKSCELEGKFLAFNASGYYQTETPRAWDGFWVRAASECQIWSKPARPAFYEIRLEKGWNQVGIPYTDYELDRTTCKIEGSAWNYDAKGKSYVKSAGLPNFVPGKGYWIKARTGCRLIFRQAGK